jgi:hypothetical protein
MKGDGKRGLAMNLIPIYDATAPITCTIGTHQIAGRVELLERLRADLRWLERTDHGLVLHFEKRPEVETDLHTFAVDEKRCCQFWGFAVHAADDDLTLRWDAPPDARHLLTDIASYLEGDQPLTELSGLL